MKLLFAFLCLSIIFNAFLFIRMLFYKRASLRDELTNLFNFRALRKYLKLNLKKNPLGLVILDIDNFKDFNRISIHKGDDVLKEFADVLTKNIFSVNFVSRYRSGDEFALVFNKISSSEAILKVNEIKLFFQNYIFVCLPEMPDYRISFSFGFAYSMPDNDDINNLFEIAELELARAKKEKQ